MGLAVFEKRVLRTFGPKRDEIKGQRETHTEELHIGCTVRQI
jgi:hypothetical protein